MALPHIHLLLREEVLQTPMIGINLKPLHRDSVSKTSAQKLPLLTTSQMWYNPSHDLSTMYINMPLPSHSA